MINLKNIYLLVFLIFVYSYANAKRVDSIVYKPENNFKFEGGKNNVISDKKNTLYPFMAKLVGIRRGEANTVSIVHIGDSHIQADHTTGMIRRQMIANFGNAGRGLVAPHKLAKTNGAGNYRISSADSWEFTRLIRPGEIPIGVAGLGLQVNDAIASINVETIDESYPGEWAFNKITAFYDLEKANAEVFEDLLLERDTLGNYAENFILKRHVSNFDIMFTSPVDNKISFFGLNLTNGKSGILYNTIGVNGAHYSDYTSQELLCKQVSYLQPDLIIISLGTNEAYAGSVNEERLYSHISDFVFNLRHRSPNAAIILTTPAETLRRYSRKKRAPNHLTSEVRDVIVKFAQNNGYAYWDLYNITGGKNSALQWNKKGLLAYDGIHFTRTGYEFTGELLFEAFTKSYNEYIRKNNGSF